MALNVMMERAQAQRTNALALHERADGEDFDG
jgi:hypothetical protein